MTLQDNSILTVTTTQRIGVVGQFVGYHRWLAAPLEVAFLRDYHRHVFHVTVEVSVDESDRELEFFMCQRKLQQTLNEQYADKMFEYSCEQLAKMIASAFYARVCSNRAGSIEVTVSEDGENYGKYCMRIVGNVTRTVA